MAVQLNNVSLGGYLTKDPELRFTNDGIPVCNFSLAINRRGKSDEADFFDVVAWRAQGEAVANYMKKGSPVIVVGFLQQQRWKDRDSGQNRSRVVVQATDVQFVATKGEGNGNGGQQRQSQPRQQPRQNEPAPQYQNGTGGYHNNLPDADFDDIPF